MAQKRGAHWEGTGREKDRSGNVAMGTGTAVTVMIRAVDATEQNIGGTHRWREGDRDWL